MLGRMSKVGSVLVALTLVACVGSEVTQTGANHPAKPQGCPVKIFPSTTPDYKWEDIASVESHCHFTQGRSACIEELKKRTCEVGGDTLYAFKDGKQGENTVVIATVALRTGASDMHAAVANGSGDAPKPSGDTAPSPPPQTTPPSAAGACDPPCSPGYKCSSEGQCLALCNPPCGEGMRCNQQRMCESAAPAPPAP
jgi:hypothetical protein